ncbi:hypothetical protein OS493_035207 [Desmophyllum pertusum]|uniref:Death domain-containing protein n=1 Tax=Desmophyllum pertusum TaxID=174260 RepID=A0A9W9ZVX0_9CNID|nr:hypothetical protein OS493_035207 [Desmophyllum pertusum]
MSQDIYQEQSYREQEDSALMQLKSDGFEELGSNVGQERGYIYNQESLTVSIQLGEGYKPVNSQQESIEFTVHVHSSVWWSTGHAIRVTLQGSSADANSPKILRGRIAVQGQHGHVLEDHFYQSDLCAYVRRILGVERVIFNLKLVAQKLGLSEQMLNQVVTDHWQSEAEQLKRVLKNWLERQANTEERQANTDERQANTEDCAVLRKALEGLEPEEYKVKERGQLHVRNLRELALIYKGLQHNDPHMVKYLGREIKALCKSVLRDCCIEMATSEMGFNLETEKYATFLVLHRRISKDVAKKFKNMHSSSEDYRASDIFLMIVPHLIQAIKEVFKDERIPQAQSGLRGMDDTEALNEIASDIKKTVENKNISWLSCHVCKILENLCLNNNDDDRSTEDEIRNWGGSLSIITMLSFLKKFFQCSEAQRLYSRLRVFSVSIREIQLNPSDFEGSFLRDFYNVALSLLQFAKFDPSQLVRFKLIIPTNSSNTQANDVLKYDKSNETFSQQFWIRKESEGELRLEAIAHVHMKGHIRSIGARRNMRCTKAGTVVELRLSHKWGSETIDLEDFVTLTDPTARGTCVPDLEITAEMGQLTIRNEYPTLPTTSDSTVGNYNRSSSFVHQPRGHVGKNDSSSTLS